MAETLKIDVVSDVVCPWCYLGKRRLERGLALVPEVAVEVRWRPFQLDPTIPLAGIDRRAYLERKFGSAESRAPHHQRIADMGKAEGIDYRFERIERSPNTLDAHRLIRWASIGGCGEGMVERLFRAYFTEGRDIGDADVLTSVAGDGGLDRDAVAERLATGEDRAEVEAEIAHAHRLGITGVPCFVIAERYAVTGAQAPETIAQAVHRVVEERAARPVPEDQPPEQRMA